MLEDFERRVDQAERGELSIFGCGVLARDLWTEVQRLRNGVSLLVKSTEPLETKREMAKTLIGAGRN